MASHRFDPRTGRFHDAASGRFISEKSIRDGVDRAVEASAQQMAALSARLRTGELTASEFQSELMAEIKAANVAAALAAYGGREQMTLARWGTVGQIIRGQYQYARQFVADVIDGRQRQNGRMDNRARQYAQSARTAYENIRRREQASAGMRFERNILHASESCRSCIAQTSLGTVPIGTLLPIGARTCRGNCRCTMTYSASTDLEDVA